MYDRMRKQVLKQAIQNIEVIQKGLRNTRECMYF